MCFGGSSKKEPTPAPPPPPPAPAPVPQPADTSPQNTADQKRSGVEAAKAGLISTIKTTPQGVTGKGPDLSASKAGGSLEAMFPSTKKKTTGS
ncbi:MAG: hypothetical protein ACPGWM_03940 [Flavobacteriales bacterium]